MGVGDTTIHPSKNKGLQSVFSKQSINNLKNNNDYEINYSYMV